MAGLDVSASGRPITKKALLVGISYYNEIRENGWKSTPIRTSIPNVKKFRKFLQDQLEYTDITVMTDEGGVEERLLPTEANLVYPLPQLHPRLTYPNNPPSLQNREIRALVRDAEPGDRRVFYFAGHSEQMLHGSESWDGLDDALVALNGYSIRDSNLHKWLVEPLPPGSTLTAIFDSCASGALLDLPHYWCNSVYCPWLSEARRRSNTLRNRVVRRDCGYVRPLTRSLSGSSEGSGGQSPSFPQITRLMGTPQSTLSWLGEGNERCASPERLFECDGWCGKGKQTTGTLPHADVISISFSPNKACWHANPHDCCYLPVTSPLIKILKEDPELTYAELATRLNHAAYTSARRVHRTPRGIVGFFGGIFFSFIRRRLRKVKGGEGVDHGYQELQLGSMAPLDMNRKFVL